MPSYQFLLDVQGLFLLLLVQLYFVLVVLHHADGLLQVALRLLQLLLESPVVVLDLVQLALHEDGLVELLLLLLPQPVDFPVQLVVVLVVAVHLLLQLHLQRVDLVPQHLVLVLLLRDPLHEVRLLLILDPTP